MCIIERKIRLLYSELCDECQCLVNTVALWAAGNLDYFSTTCLRFGNNRSESDAANTTDTVVSVAIRRIEGIYGKYMILCS